MKLNLFKRLQYFFNGYEPPTPEDHLRDFDRVFNRPWKKHSLNKNSSKVDFRTFSCTAESSLDIFLFVDKCISKNISIKDMFIDGPFTGSKVFQFSANTDLSTLRYWGSKIEDAQVLIQTLRQCGLKENSMERDMTIGI